MGTETEPGPWLCGLPPAPPAPGRGSTLGGTQVTNSRHSPCDVPSHSLPWPRPPRPAVALSPPPPSGLGAATGGGRDSFTPCGCCGHRSSDRHKPRPWGPAGAAGLPVAGPNPAKRDWSPRERVELSRAGSRALLPRPAPAPPAPRRVRAQAEVSTGPLCALQTGGAQASPKNGGTVQARPMPGIWPHRHCHWGKEVLETGRSPGRMARTPKHRCPGPRPRSADDAPAGH